MSTNGTTPQIEKLFLHWILKNPQYFKVVDGNFYKSEEIKFIYNAIRNEWMASADKLTPGIKEIKTLVRSMDPDEKISNDLMSAILKNDSADFREEFILNRFKAWILSNSTIAGLVDSIEQIKNVDRINFDQVMSKVDAIKNIMMEKTSIDLGDNHIGLDFDDPDAHNQETFLNKITTGFSTLDNMFGGGFDRKTFNVLLGSPGCGKSIWLQNFCVNVADAGYNVLYVTLELSEKKALKRMGAMRLGIPINEYDTIAKDREFMKSRIEEANRKCTAGVFDREPGKIWLREFPAGTATIGDIENVVKLVHEKTGRSVDFLAVDYIQIMKPEKHLQIDNMLYLKGKHLAEGIRAIAQKYNLVSVTATQIAKEKYGANDIALNDIPESKAIADTADTVMAIILTPPMKIEGRYHLKKLKLRDSDCEYERIAFDLNKTTLKVYNDNFFDSVI